MRDINLLIVATISQVVGVKLGKTSGTGSQLITDVMMCLSVFVVWMWVWYLAMLRAFRSNESNFWYICAYSSFFGPVIGVAEMIQVLGGGNIGVTRQCFEIGLGGILCMYLWGTISRIFAAFRRAITDLWNARPPSPTPTTTPSNPDPSMPQEHTSVDMTVPSHRYDALMHDPLVRAEVSRRSLQHDPPASQAQQSRLRGNLSDPHLYPRSQPRFRHEVARRRYDPLWWPPSESRR